MNETCPCCGNKDENMLLITVDHVHCLKCGDGYDIPGLSVRVDNVERLRRAVELLLTDYRTEGCSDPNCTVCEKSQYAKEFAEEALVKTGPTPVWTEDDLTPLSREVLFGIYMMACLDSMPEGGEDPSDYGVIYSTFEKEPVMKIIRQLAEMRLVK